MDYFLTPTELSELNNRLDALESLIYDSGVVTVNNNLRYRIKNGFCTIYINQINPTVNWLEVGTLPAAARPTRGFNFCGFHGPNGRIPMSVSIASSGLVQVSTETTSTGNDGLASATYPL